MSYFHRERRSFPWPLVLTIVWKVACINRIYSTQTCNSTLPFVQVAVCTDTIGWRNNSLKMVVLITGSGLHFAYDGQLAGIIIPNDMKCHLKEPEVRLLQGLHIFVHFQGGYKRGTYLRCDEVSSRKKLSSFLWKNLVFYVFSKKKLRKIV